MVLGVQSRDQWVKVMLQNENNENQWAVVAMAEGSSPVDVVDEMIAKEASLLASTSFSLPSSLLVLVSPSVNPCNGHGPFRPSIRFLSSQSNISLALSNIIMSIPTLNLSGPSMGALFLLLPLY